MLNAQQIHTHVRQFLARNTDTRTTAHRIVNRKRKMLLWIFCWTLNDEGMAVCPIVRFGYWQSLLKHVRFFFSYVYLLSSIFALNFPNHVLQWAYGDFFFSYSQVRSLCYLKGNVVSDGSVNLHHTIRSMCCFSICKIARGHRTLKWLKNLSGYCSQAEFLWKSVAVLLLSLLIKLTVLSLRLSWLIHLYDGNLWPMMHNALQPHSMSIGRTTWTTTIVFTPNQWKMFHWQNPIQMSNELCVELILIQKKKKNFFPVLPMSLIWRLQIRTQC